MDLPQVLWLDCSWRRERMTKMGKNSLKGTTTCYITNARADARFRPGLAARRVRRMRRGRRRG